MKRFSDSWRPLTLIICLNVIVSISSVATAVVSKQMIDRSISKGFNDAAAYIALFAILLIVQIFLGALISLKTGKLKVTMSHKLQKQFIERLYKTEWTALHKYHNGDIQTRLTSDVTNIADAWTNTFPTMVSLFVQLITAFFTLWHFDRSLAIFAFILGPVSIAVSWIVGRSLKKMQHQIQAAESRYRSFLLESVHNMLIVKTFEHEQESMKQIEYHQQNKLYWVIKQQLVTVRTSLIMGIGYRIGFFLAFAVGAFKLSAGTTTFGTFTAFLQLVGQIQGPMEGLSRSLPNVISTLASAERLMEFEALNSEAEKTTNAVSIETMTSLNLEHVNFSYEDHMPILSDISFSIKKGEIIAFVGTTGEGKTTLLRLLLALLQPNDGEIYIYDSDLRKKNVSSDTRSYFSYVPQGNTLFSGTIAENLRIGRTTATNEELIVASQNACAWDFIQKLPHGLDTIIGESGHGLSEGQSQRIAIARALLRQSPILLLDEATSALDLNTEWAVLQSIKKMAPQKTCIAITHRLSVTDICDRVYQLSEGKLIELKERKGQP